MLHADAILNAAMATFSSPPTHAGNLYALPFWQDEIIIPYDGGGCKREFEIVVRQFIGHRFSMQHIIFCVVLV
jgi:hypothetical protein